MNERRALHIGAALLLVLLTLAAFERGRHLLDFYFFQLKSSLYYILIFSIALGAFLSFLFLGFSPFRQFQRPTQDRSGLRTSQLSQPLHSAEIAMELGQDQLAQDLLQHVPDSDESSWLALKRLADLELEKGNALQAEVFYEKALRRSEGTDRALVLFALAGLYEQQDLLDRAEDYYQQVLISVPDGREALLRLRKIAIRSGEWRKALLWHQRLEHSTLNEPSPEQEGELKIGICYEAARMEFDESEYASALTRVKEIVRMKPSFIPAYILAAEIYEKTGNDAGAVKYLEKGLRANLHSALLIRTAEHYLARNLPGHAIEFYQQVIRSHPENTWLEYELGNLYLQLEMIEEALVSFRSIARMQPDWLLNKKALAELNFRTGRIQEAAAQFADLVRSLKEQSLLPWQCSVCEMPYGAYQSCCSNCMEWNTIEMNQAGYMEASNEKATAFRLPIRS